MTVTVARLIGRAAYIAGTFDTKGRELTFIRNCLEKLGLAHRHRRSRHRRKPSPADIGPAEVARFHPKGATAVFSGDRGAAVAAMAEAFERFIARAARYRRLISRRRLAAARRSPRRPCGACPSACPR